MYPLPVSLVGRERMCECCVEADTVSTLLARIAYDVQFITWRPAFGLLVLEHTYAHAYFFLELTPVPSPALQESLQRTQLLVFLGYHFQARHERAVGHRQVHLGRLLQYSPCCFGTRL